MLGSVKVVDGDRVPLLGQRQGNSPSDATGCAGDEANTPFRVRFYSQLPLALRRFYPERFVLADDPAVLHTPYDPANGRKGITFVGPHVGIAA
jgi:hypothetical protein